VEDWIRREGNSFKPLLCLRPGKDARKIFYRIRKETDWAATE